MVHTVDHSLEPLWNALGFPGIKREKILKSCLLEIESGRARKGLLLFWFSFVRFSDWR